MHCAGISTTVTAIPIANGRVVARIEVVLTDAVANKGRVHSRPFTLGQSTAINPWKIIVIALISRLVIALRYVIIEGITVIDTGVKRFAKQISFTAHEFHRRAEPDALQDGQDDIAIGFGCHRRPRHIIKGHARKALLANVTLHAVHQRYIATGEDIVVVAIVVIILILIREDLPKLPSIQSVAAQER